MTPLLLAIVTAATVAGSAPDAMGVAPALPIAQPAQTPPAKPAPASIGAEVLVLHATNDGSGIDPKIGKLPELSKPPFSSYNSYKQLDRSSLSLEKGKSGSIKLPTGRELRIVYKDTMEPQKQGEPRRYIVSASIQKPDGNTFLPLLEVNAKAGEYFFVAGEQYKGGSLVVGIKVTTP
jgi:hypothetical protein